MGGKSHPCPARQNARTLAVHTPPLIGVTTGNRDNFPNHPEQYMIAVKNAGGIAEFVYPGAGKKGLADHYDGFLIPGGKDMSPMLYNEKQQCEIRPEEERRTAFELFLLREAVARKKPVLGICYGAQVMNVFFGGSLYQDILSQHQRAYDHRQGFHFVEIRQNPHLACGTYAVNSSHHQAVKRTGKGLVPFAFSPDGTVEAIYLENFPFMMGVQWHPERTDTELSSSVFRALVGACNVR
ncbi:MAG: gamma-glutamyl-gamma-aminobutyrate hydrolase family protein [Nitrospirae bacterium]|nr:gamma-glutamyl-gamma-aminobutyrate hydrolase family protein [Nitrospirota bacterium]